MCGKVTVVNSGKGTFQGTVALPHEPCTLPHLHPVELSDAMSSLFAFLPNLGMPELLVIGLVVLLLFGNRLPSVMRSMGKGIVEFKKGVAGIEDESEKPKSTNP
jgi:sec-independent protein translocase protein TatA